MPQSKRSHKQKRQKKVSISAPEKGVEEDQVQSLPITPTSDTATANAKPTAAVPFLLSSEANRVGTQIIPQKPENETTISDVVDHVSTRTQHHTPSIANTYTVEKITIRKTTATNNQKNEYTCGTTAAGVSGCISNTCDSNMADDQSVLIMEENMKRFKRVCREMQRIANTTALGAAQQQREDENNAATKTIHNGPSHSDFTRGFHTNNATAASNRHDNNAIISAPLQSQQYQESSRNKKKKTKIDNCITTIPGSSSSIDADRQLSIQAPILKTCTTVVIPQELFSDDANLHSVITQAVQSNSVTSSPANQLAVIVTSTSATGCDGGHAQHEATATTLSQPKDELQITTVADESTNSHGPHYPHQPSADNTIIVYRSPVTVSLDKYASRVVTMRECSLQLWSLYNALCISAGKKTMARSARRRCATPANRIKGMNNFIKTILLNKFGWRQQQYALCTAPSSLTTPASSFLSVQTTTPTGLQTVNNDKNRNNGLTVLDLGCGRGQDVYKLEYINPARVLFVDLSDQCLRLAERRWRKNISPYHASFVQADFTVPAFLDNTQIMFYKHVQTKSLGKMIDICHCCPPPHYNNDNVRIDRGVRNSSENVTEPTRTPSNTTSSLLVAAAPASSFQQKNQEQHAIGNTIGPRYVNDKHAAIVLSSQMMHHPHSSSLRTSLSASKQHQGIFDLISCQFAAQYAADSLNTLRAFMANISYYLKPQGVFVGVVPDADRIGRLIRQHDGNWVGPHCAISLQRPSDLPYMCGDSQTHRKSTTDDHVVASADNNHNFHIPTGICYRFAMEDTLRCYEYTIQMDDMIRIAEENKLRLLLSEPAPQFARREMADPSNRHVLRRMGLARNLLSREEWDVIAMYRVFVFEKQE